MTTFEQAMLARDRTLAIRVGKYQSSDINEAAFSYGYIAGDTFKPGGTCAGSGKIIFSSIITTFKKLDKIYPEIGLLVNDTYEWVKMGEYFINDIKIDRNRSKTELELMDGMFKFNQPYVSDLSYPAQIRDVIREICKKTGVELQTENLGLRAIQQHIPKKPDKKDITFREVLSQAVQLLGFSAFFNREGKLEIRGLTESGITITADSYFLHGLTKSETEYQIAGITCKKTDKEVLTVGLRTGRSLELENSFMNQNILDDLYYDLKNLKYYPFNLNYQGHLKLQVGQWVTIKTNNNEIFKVPVLSQSFSFKGGLSSRISADSKAGSDTQYSYSGFIQRRINQVSTDMRAEVQQQLEWAEKEFDKKQKDLKDEIKTGIEQAKAKAEQVKSEINQSIEQKLQQTKSEVVEKVKQDFNQGLANANAEIGKVKQNLTNLQSSAEANIKQVKSDLAGIRTQQTTYEQSNEQNLSRITGQLADKASKSEVKQTADGIREELASLSVGGRNLLKGSKGPFMPDRKPADFDNQVLYLEQTSIYMEQGQEYIISAKTDGSFTAHHDGNKESDNVVLWIMDKAVANYQIVSDAKTGTTGTEFVWNRPTGIYHLRVNTYRKDPKKLKSVWEVKVEQGSFKTDWSPAPEDTEGLITEAKATFERTAQGLRTDLTAVQTYVSADGARTEALRTYSREETARQLTAERKVIEAGYVAKAQHTEDVRGLTRRFEELNSGGPNLVSNGATELGLKDWLANGKLTADRKHPYFKNGTAAMFVLDTTEATVAHMQQNQYNVLKRNTDYTLSFTAFASNNVSGFRALVGLLSNTDHTWKKTLYTYTKTLSPTQAERITVQFNSSDFDGFALRFDNMGSSNGRSATVWISDIDVYEGTIKRPYQPSPANGQSYADTKLAEYKQTVDGEFKKLQSSVGEMVKKTDINITPGQISFGTGKVVNGKTIASLFVQNPESIEAITKLMRITGDLIVDGSITGRNLAANTITTAHLAAGAVTTEVLAADAVTAKKLRVDYSLINKLTADDALLNNLVAKQAFINKLSTIDFSATQIKGGILKSLNNISTFDLQRGILRIIRGNGSAITLGREGLHLKKQEETILGLTYKEGSILSEFYSYNDKGSANFEIDNGSTLAISLNQSSSNFIEISPEKETVYISGGFKLYLGGGQNVSLEHTRGTFNGVDFSSFRALGTNRDELRFFRDGRIELYHKKY
ncbi:Phage hyaluronidase [Streptococcus anginosus]|uniref:carbohydrate binding domain-containing protein n=1 Tax=Streptococcus anginosus TaxID=1328 RepID=UPI000706BB07|nr:carbohydrate binding domain-containing protein [Streptococcus anginosus]ALL03439.1 Phage hyaluronidase [Streptococcus anginosus]QBX31742.1 hyaluronidase [Streptococcus phage Javan74]